MSFIRNYCYGIIFLSVMFNCNIAIGSLKFNLKNNIKSSVATTYYIHPTLGDDANKGTSKAFAFKTLAQIQKLKLTPGDKIVLANGQVYTGSLNLVNQQGNKSKPIKITSIKWDENDTEQPAIIDFKGLENGILIQDCSFLAISNLQLTANGYQTPNNSQKMRCGVLITNSDKSLMTNISLKQLVVKDVYYENAGYKRGAGEVKSANGTQKYGWGIRLISDDSEKLLKNITISNCTIADVSHTGIKLTGKGQNISDITIRDSRIENTGGPGIQMSEVNNIYVANNLVDHPGSNNDSRKWGRGSGLWTWGSSNILIEKNQFLNANGPGDSAGAHIDFNCDNVVIQYNFSYNNAGGFCEILGNNYNCAYRYNVSVNDGYRVKGKDGAFQEGKTLWLSGYVGNKAPLKGPVNTYIYNNTIYCDSTIVPKIAFANNSSGILIANNIFYTKNDFKAVLGDQYKPDTENSLITKNVIFSNNLFAHKSSWPSEASLKDTNSFYGDPIFKNPELAKINAFTPKNIKIIQHHGIDIVAFPFNKTKLNYSLKMDKDILGNKLIGKPSLGAIQPFE